MGPSGEGALLLGAVTLAELLDLVAALEGGFGRGDGEATGAGYGIGDLLPVGSSEIAAVEGVPFGTVRIDEGYGFLVGPARRGEPSRWLLLLLLLLMKLGEEGLRRKGGRGRRCSSSSHEKEEEG